MGLFQRIMGMFRSRPAPQANDPEIAAEIAASEAAVGKWFEELDPAEQELLRNFMACKDLHQMEEFIRQHPDSKLVPTMQRQLRLLSQMTHVNPLPLKVRENNFGIVGSTNYLRAEAAFWSTACDST